MNLDELESEFDENFEKNDAIINENQKALETAGQQFLTPFGFH